MPKVNLTLNGFGGGINSDADPSDLKSEGAGEDEVQVSKDLFLDKRGKITAEYPAIDTTDSTTENSENNTAATEILFHDSVIYQNTGLYRFDDQVVWSGNRHYISQTPVDGEVNPTTPADENYGIDIQVRRNRSKDYFLFLGYNAEGNMEDIFSDSYPTLKTAKVFNSGADLTIGGTTDVGDYIRWSEDTEPSTGLIPPSGSAWGALNEIDDTAEDSTLDEVKVKNKNDSLDNWDDNGLSPNQSGGAGNPLEYIFFTHKAGASTGSDDSLGIHFRVGDLGPSAKATGSIAFTGIPDAGDTIVITSTDGTQRTYTAQDTENLGANQFDRNANDVGGGSVSNYSGIAESLKDCITNAAGHGSKISVSRSTATLNLEQATEGYDGSVTMVENLTNATSSGFSGGSSGTPGFHGENFKPSDFDGRDIAIGMLVTDLDDFEGLYIVAGCHQTDPKLYYKGTTASSDVKIWKVTPNMVIEAGGIDAFHRYEIKHEDAIWEGSDYDVNSIKQFAIIAAFSGAVYEGDAFGIVRINEIAFNSTETLYGWDNFKWHLSQTAITKNKVESLPLQYSGVSAEVPFIGKNNPHKFKLWRPEEQSATTDEFEGQMAGGKIYYQRSDGTEDENATGTKFLLAEYDWAKGVKASGEDDFTAWSTDAGNSKDYAEIELNDPPMHSTYEIESGYPKDTSTVNAAWKTATTVGRQVYIGNVSTEKTQVFDPSSKNIIVNRTGSGYIEQAATNWSGKAQISFHFVSVASSNMQDDGQFTLIDAEGGQASFKVDAGSTSADGTKDGDGNYIIGTSGVQYSDGSTMTDQANRFISCLNHANQTDVKITGVLNTHEGPNTPIVVLTQDTAGVAGNTNITCQAIISQLYIRNPFTDSASTEVRFNNTANVAAFVGGHKNGFATGSTLYIAGDEGNNLTGNSTKGIYEIASFTNRGASDGNYIADTRMVLTSVPGTTAATINAAMTLRFTALGDFKGHRILKSAVGKPAGFSDIAFVDLQLGGDTIKVLKSVGDRLFVFGANNLTIVNVAQDIEFIEATMPGHGIKLPRQVCKFGENLAYVNASGVYLFAQDQSMNISDPNLSNVDFNVDQCRIAYDDYRKLLVVWSEDSKQYYFSLLTQTWVGATETAINPTTNAVIGDSNYNYYMVTGQPYKIGVQTAATTENRKAQLITGKISMGNIAQEKNFYKIYLNVKNAKNLDIWIRTDNSHNNNTAITVNHIPTSDLLTSGFSGGEATLELLDATRANYDDSGGDYFTLTDMDGTAKTYIFDTSTASGSTGTVQGGTGYILIGMSDVTETKTAIATNVKNAIEHANGHGPGKFHITQKEGLLKLVSYTQVFNSDTADLSNGTNEISLRSSGLLSSSTKGKWLEIRFLADNNNCTSDMIISDISIVFKGRNIK